jgi:hypothetical protein
MKSEEKQGGNFKLILSNKVKWELILFFFVWLIITGILLQKGLVFELNENNYLFSILWSLIYLSTGAVLFLNLIWDLFGYSEIDLEVEKNLLIVKKNIFFIKSEKTFEFNRIKYLKCEVDFESNYWQTEILTGLKFFTSGDLKINFIYNNKKVWIGNNLTKKEADFIFKSLKNHT